MKVLLAYQPGELRVVEMEKPTPGPREVLCKVAHCGVCATRCPYELKPYETLPHQLAFYREFVKAHADEV